MNNNYLQKWLNSMDESGQETEKSIFDRHLTKPVLYVGILLVGKCDGSPRLNCVKLQEVISTVNDNGKTFNLLIDRFQPVVKVVQSVSDEKEKIKAILSDWADNSGLNLILTTGGTGFMCYDVTPEATREVIEKEATSMMIAITIASLKVTPNAMISRAVCGLRNNVLIVNLPGSDQASSECFSVILPALPHGLSLRTEGNNRIPTFESAKDQSLSSQESSDFCFCCEDKRFTPFPRRMSISSLRSRRAQSRSGTSSQHRLRALKLSRRNHHIDQVPNHIPSMERLSFQRNVDENMESTINSDGHRLSFESPSLQNKLQPDSSEYNFSKVARRLRYSPYAMISCEKALTLVLHNSTALTVLEKHYKDAFGYILAEDVRAKNNFPAFSSAAIDGYAVRASETPGNKEVVEEVNLQSISYLASGKTMRVFCGGPLPIMTDAVAPMEDTLLLQGSQNEKKIAIQVLKSVTPGENIHPMGHNIKKGEVVATRGTQLSSSDIGTLASIGVNQVVVHRKPTVAVFSTGGRIFGFDADQARPDAILDANRISLLLALRQNGFDAIDMGAANDADSLKGAIVQSCSKADVIISSGGVSIGENDNVKPVLESLRATVHFGRVSMKPGKLTTFATLDTEFGRKCYFGLPGNPSATIVSYHLFVLPSLHRMSGQMEPQQTVIKSKVSFDVELGHVPEYRRIKLRWEEDESVPWAESTGRPGCGRFSSMVGATALLMLPPKLNKVTKLKQGQLVDAFVIDRL